VASPGLFSSNVRPLTISCKEKILTDLPTMFLTLGKSAATLWSFPKMGCLAIFVVRCVC
jgi:hypothetical protein